MADDDVLHKADALMHRHRVFVAGAGEEQDGEDVPLLTEVVSPDTLPEVAPAQTPVDLAELRNALAFEMEAWLDEELPQHVLRVLDGITDQLIIQLSLKARAELLPKLQSILEAPSRPVTPDSTGE